MVLNQEPIAGYACTMSTKVSNQCNLYLRKADDTVGRSGHELCWEVEHYPNDTNSLAVSMHDLQRRVGNLVSM
jgi:hypothetical protein